MEQKVAKAGRPRSFDDAEARRAIQHVFWKQGFAATSLDDLSTATGLHKPSLYGAFGNKQAMFTDSFKAFLRERGEAMTAALAEPKLHDALTAHFTGITDLYTGSETARGCFLASAAVPLASTDEAVAERIRRSLALQEEAFVTRLRQGDADGELTPGLDPQSAADLVLGTQLRLSVQARAGAPKASLEKLWRRVVDAIAPV
jgi:TetR/AcrR family transcriptional regulator, copper-responsive repressor